MTQIVYRGNLTSAEFPMLSEFQGRNIMVPQIDQNFSAQVNSQKDRDRDRSIAQAYYMHNVIPTDAGLLSVGYQQIAMAPPDGDGTFTDMLTIRDSADNKGYLGITSTGRCYVLLSTAAGWIRTTDKAPVAGSIVTTAYVNGITYIYFGGVGCFKYNFATNALDAVTLTALSGAVIGITASFGYMIAWTINTIAWSSTLDPTDFTPSLITGAGGGPVQQIKAAITCCLVHAAGFMVYTKTNAVAAIYSGNSQFPFIFKEIVSSSGVASPSVVSYDAVSTNHYAYTTAGFQALNTQQAQNIFPTVTDFIAGSQFEDFNEVTNTFVNTVLGSPMKKKVVSIASRYMIISYGINSLTHALVYDFALARWGKLKVPHVDCFEYQVFDPTVVETPRRSIGFLQADGTVQVLLMTYDSSVASGVLVLGKYQYIRTQMLTMHQVNLENIKASSNFTCTVYTAVDGTNRSAANTVLTRTAGLARTYNCRTTGLNHSLLLKGGFHLCSLVLTFSTAGTPRLGY